MKWTVWAAGRLASGLLWVLAGWGVDRINSRDKVADPLGKRVWHLVVLLAFIAVVIVVATGIARLTP